MASRDPASARVLAAPPAPGDFAVRPLHLISFSAERRGFNNGCSAGTLTLAASRLNFVCPEDRTKGVSVDRTQIEVVDNDGIRLYSNQKYHFKIAGKSKDDVHRLFEAWMSKTPVSPLTSSN
jgi:hypothetical protein